MYLNTVADLATIPGPIPLNTEFIVSGRWQTGDGGGGIFIWVPNGQFIGGIPAADSGIIFTTTLDTSGRFKRVFSGPINVQWFGAIKGANNGTSLITDVTTYVHAARDSVAFANNGTLYFPKGEYVGAFEFFYDSVTQNEINLVGDGQGTVLKSNGTVDRDNKHRPVLSLGFRVPHWRYARISNLLINGSSDDLSQNLYSYGVTFIDVNNDANTNLSGRGFLRK